MTLDTLKISCRNVQNGGLYQCIKATQMYLERLPPLKHQIDRQLSDDDDGDGLEVDDMIVVVMLPLLRSCDFVCRATMQLPLAFSVFLFPFIRREIWHRNVLSRFYSLLASEQRVGF